MLEELDRAGRELAMKEALRQARDLILEQESQKELLRSEVAFHKAEAAEWHRAYDKKHVAHLNDLRESAFRRKQRDYWKQNLDFIPYWLQLLFIPKAVRHGTPTQEIKGG